MNYNNIDNKILPLFIIIFICLQTSLIKAEIDVSTIENNEHYILVTGFGPWHIHDENPSGLAALFLNDTTISTYHIIGIELPVDFNESVTKMIQSIESYDPEFILSLGLAANAKSVRLENLAVNIQFDSLDDHPFQTIKRINPNGRLFLQTTLDVKESISAMKKIEIPVIQSYSAGLYICNTLFYKTLSYLQEYSPDVPMGFLHVPQINPMNQNDIDLDMIVNAARVCIIVYIENK
ncbi:MAG: hypothetical protein V1920_06080 [Bacillota bacterium]